MRGGANVSVTHVYLRLCHTTSLIKDSFSAFCLNRSVGYATRALNKKTSEKYPLFITYYTYKWNIFWTVCFLAIWYREVDQQTEVF